MTRIVSRCGVFTALHLFLAVRREASELLEESAFVKDVNLSGPQ